MRVIQQYSLCQLHYVLKVYIDKLLKDSFIGPSMIDHHYYSNLHYIIFGEGIINDAVSLSLFNTL